MGSGLEQAVSQLVALRPGQLWNFGKDFRLADVLDACGYLNGQYRSDASVTLKTDYTECVVRCVAGRRA